MRLFTILTLSFFVFGSNAQVPSYIVDTTCFTALTLEGGQTEIQFADPFGLGMKLSFYLVVFAEVICSIFIILGLKTRMAASVLVFNMLVAVFVMATNGEVPELALMYFISYVLILVFGGGKYSIDFNLNSKKKR